MFVDDDLLKEEIHLQAERFFLSEKAQERIMAIPHRYSRPRYSYRYLSWRRPDKRSDKRYGRHWYRIRSIAASFLFLAFLTTYLTINQNDSAIAFYQESIDPVGLFTAAIYME